MRIEHAMDRTGAKRVALDSLGAVFQRLSSSELLRPELFRLGARLKQLGADVLVTVERPEDGSHIGAHSFEEFVADNVLVLKNTLALERRRRTIEVLKLRSAPHRTGQHPMTILGKGAVVIALPEIQLEQPSQLVRVPSGVPALDVMCDGGFLRDSVVLVSGATGTGKTLLATSFINGGIVAGERCLMLGFEESRSQLVRNATSWGMDFEQATETGRLRIDCCYPESRSLEEHLLHILDLVDEFKPDRLTLDSLSALERGSTHNNFREFVTALGARLKQRQIATLLTATGATSLDLSSATEAHLSSLTDSIILLRYVEIAGRVLRALTVLKMRGSRHDTDIRAFNINARGMQIQEPLRNLVGIISGNIRALPGVDTVRLESMFDDN